MKIWISALTLAAALAIGLSFPGSAHQETAGKLKIGHPWIREAVAVRASRVTTSISSANLTSLLAFGDEANRQGAAAALLAIAPKN